MKTKLIAIALFGLTAAAVAYYPNLQGHPDPDPRPDPAAQLPPVEPGSNHRPVVDVVFALPETDRGLLLEGRAQATLWGEEGGAHPLILRDIAPDVDPAGRTYRVRMALEAPEADFGRTVTVTVSAGAGAPVAVD